MTVAGENPPSKSICTEEPTWSLAADSARRPVGEMLTRVASAPVRKQLQPCDVGHRGCRPPVRVGDRWSHFGTSLSSTCLAVAAASIAVVSAVLSCSTDDAICWRWRRMVSRAARSCCRSAVTCCSCGANCVQLCGRRGERDLHRPAQVLLLVQRGFQAARRRHIAHRHEQRWEPVGMIGQRHTQEDDAAARARDVVDLAFGRRRAAADARES